MTIVNEHIEIETRLAKIRRKGVIVRTYSDTDNFVNVAQWTATDFEDCGEEGVMYFREQADFPSIAIHGDHIHVLVRDKDTWELANIDKDKAKDIVDRFKKFLGNKGIQIVEITDVDLG